MTLGVLCQHQVPFADNQMMIRGRQNDSSPARDDGFAILSAADGMASLAIQPFCQRGAERFIDVQYHENWQRQMHGEGAEDL